MEEMLKILDVKKINELYIHYFDSLGNEKTIKIEEAKDEEEEKGE